MAAAREALLLQWMARRALVMALAAQTGMLEYDASDFGSAAFFVQVKMAYCTMKYASK